MNSREKLLALAISGLLALVVLYWGVTSVQDWFAQRQNRIDTLTRDLKKKKAELLKAQLASKRLADYELQSLPSHVEVAQSAYHEWLVNTTSDAQLRDVEIETLKPRANQRTYYALPYTLRARGTLEQVTRWLHRFAAEDRLHRIDLFALKPLKDSKDLGLVLAVTALSVNSAPRQGFGPRPRENWPDFATFRDPLLNRNVFGPPNAAPRWETGSRLTATKGKSWDTTLKATDADPLDKLTYSLVSTTATGLKVDASGRVQWSPDATGEYEVQVAVRDDGLPSKDVMHTIKLVVSDPPPMVVVDSGPKKPSFDLAKYTVFTTAVEVNGEPEAWLLTRTTGEMRRLHIKDRFEIGSRQGEIMSIEGSELKIASEGKAWTLSLGGTLSEARELAPLAELESN